MAARPCPVSINECEGVDYPITNFSSEAPDPITFVSPIYPKIPPPGFLPPSVTPEDPCIELGIASSEVSQVYADALANAYAEYCADPVNPTLPPNPPADWPPYDPWPPPEPPVNPPPPPLPPNYDPETPVLLASPTFDNVVSTWVCKDVDYVGQMQGRGADLREYYYTLVGATSYAEFLITVVDGTIPPGLSLKNDYEYAEFTETASTGRLASLIGTPTETGRYTFTVRGEVVGRPDLFGELTHTIWVFGLPDKSIKVGYTCDPYSEFYEADGGIPPYLYALDSGYLPDGLSLDADGELRGTPTAAGLFTYWVEISDSGGAVCTVECNCTILAGITISNPDLADTMEDFGCSQTFLGAGGTGPYTFTLSSGSLPTGLTLYSTGLLQGVPTTQGDYTFNVKVEDSAGLECVVECSITVVACAAITTSTLPDAYKGFAYSEFLEAAGGVPPYTYDLKSGSLPEGLSLDADGEIHGTSTDTGGLHSFTAEVEDSLGGKCSRDLTIMAYSTGGELLHPYNSSYVVDEYGEGVFMVSPWWPVSTPFVFTVTGGTFPPGFTLDANGFYHGTPTDVDHFYFTIRAANPGGGYLEGDFDIIIDTL